MPPTTPAYVSVKMASAATFMPTCFIIVRDLRPDQLAAIAISAATFSFIAQSKYIPSSSATDDKASPISVLGVPG